MENQQRFADSDRGGLAEFVSAVAILAVVASVLAVPVVALIAVAAGAVGAAIGYGIASLRQSPTTVRSTESRRSTQYVTAD
jgi:membrane protein YqaA with SNARE-associated domain